MIKFIKDMDTESKVFSIFAAVMMFWILCLNHVGSFNVAITYNSLDGKIGYQTNSGWHITSPFVRTSEVPSGAGRISISGLNSSSSILNDKIVKFVLTPEALAELVKIETFHYAYTHHTLTPYAYSGKKFSFFEILDEHKSANKAPNQ